MQVFPTQHHNLTDIKKTTPYKKRSKARIIRSVWFNKEAHPEKHYRELIMLFISWRNEQIDLLGNCSTFEERFSHLKDEISTQMSQYAIFGEKLDQIQENLNEINEEHFDTIAPNTQQTELQDETEGANELHCNVTLMQKSKKGKNYNFIFQTSPTKYKRAVGFDHKSHQIAKHMQTTGSPTKILGAREENEQQFINQGTTIIEAISSDIDFHSQN